MSQALVVHFREWLYDETPFVFPTVDFFDDFASPKFTVLGHLVIAVLLAKMAAHNRDLQHSTADDFVFVVVSVGVIFVLGVLEKFKDGFHRMFLKAEDRN